MKIAFVSSEAVPFAKTGGLADVAGALPPALEKLGNEIKLFIPGYSSIDENRFDITLNPAIGEVPVKINHSIYPAKVYRTILPGSNIEVNLINSPQYFNRETLYTDDPDEDERFIFFSKAVLESIQRMHWKPDVIHCNDWQTGLIPLYIKDNYSWDKMFSETAVLFTIHNIGYQGRFNRKALHNGDIMENLFYPGGPVEYYGDVSFMKTAIHFSDIVNTVSETYAQEILTPEFGLGMEGVLADREDDLYGIVNGVDYSSWNPEKDKFIKHHYSIDDLSGKEKNKKALLNHFNLPYDKNIPVTGIVSRLAIQKGFDIIEDALEKLAELNTKLVVLGNGEKKYEKMFVELQEKHPEKVGLHIGFSNKLSHLVEAGSDIFLMPSHYEPCGLNQIYSLKYGTVPVVRKTGGLADTVDDGLENKETGTGFVFEKYSGEALLKTMKTALETFNDKETWLKIQKNGMKKNYSWEQSAKKYLDLYEKAVKKRRNKNLS